MLCLAVCNFKYLHLKKIFFPLSCELSSNWVLLLNLATLPTLPRYQAYQCRTYESSLKLAKSNCYGITSHYSSQITTILKKKKKTQTLDLGSCISTGVFTRHSLVVSNPFNTDSSVWSASYKLNQPPRRKSNKTMKLLHCYYYCLLCVSWKLFQHAFYFHVMENTGVCSGYCLVEQRKSIHHRWEIASSNPDDAIDIRSWECSLGGKDGIIFSAFDQNDTKRSWDSVSPWSCAVSTFLLVPHDTA